MRNKNKKEGESTQDEKKFWFYNINIRSKICAVCDPCAMYFVNGYRRAAFDGFNS